MTDDLRFVSVLNGFAAYKLERHSMSNQSRIYMTVFDFDEIRCGGFMITSL